MRRVLTRALASGPPFKQEKLSQAELDVIKQTQAFEKDLEKQNWAKNFASDSDSDHYQVPEVAPPSSTLTPAEFSSDEEVVPFFIDDLKQVQYVYKPRLKLDFDEQGFATIYENHPKLLSFPKFKYCKSIYWSYFLAGYFFLNHVYFGSLASVIALLMPSIYLSRALVTHRIAINQPGTHLLISSQRFRWLPMRHYEIDIKDFDQPKGRKIALWKAYEFPDDLKTFAEIASLEKYAYIKRLPKKYWSFMLLPGQPEKVNREILVNALNGVYIDTEGGGGEDIQQRYVVMERKPIENS